MVSSVFCLLLGWVLGIAGASKHSLVSASVDSRGEVSSLTEVPSFDDFVRRHGRTYLPGSEEYERRRLLFQEQVQRVLRHNGRPRRTWTAAVNVLADRTPDELRSLRGLKGPRAQAFPQRKEKLSLMSLFQVREYRSSNKFVGKLSQAHAGYPSASPYNVSGLPTEFSWRGRLQAMSDVRTQGGCGACWAHSTSVVLRAHSELYQTDRTFSTQELISCANNTHECGGKGGCNGAAPQLAFDYLGERGLHSEEDWPYEEEHGKCRAPRGSKKGAAKKAGEGGAEALVLDRSFNKLFEWTGVTLLTADFFSAPPDGLGRKLGYTGYHRLAINRADDLMRALYEKGPVAVVVFADIAWNMYSTGVMDACPIGEKDDWVIDHSVVVAGYGVASVDPDFGEQGQSLPYWLLQNSWGPEYGEGGYIRLMRRASAKEESEACNFDIRPDYADWCDNWPMAKVTVCGACGLLYNMVVPSFELGREGLLSRQPEVRAVKLTTPMPEVP